MNSGKTRVAWLYPGFSDFSALSLCSSFYVQHSRVENRLERAPHDLEDSSAMRFDHPPQGSVVNLQRLRHLLRGALPHRCGILDVGKEKCHRTNRERFPHPTILILYWGMAGEGLFTPASSTWHPPCQQLTGAYPVPESTPGRSGWCPGRKPSVNLAHTPAPGRTLPRS